MVDDDDRALEGSKKFAYEAGAFYAPASKLCVRLTLSEIGYIMFLMTINSLGELVRAIGILCIIAFLFNHSSRWLRLVGLGTLIAANIYLILSFFNTQGTLTATAFHNLQVLLGVSLAIYSLIIMYISLFKSRS